MALDEYSVVAMAIQKMDNKLEKLQDEIVDIGKVLAKQDVILEKMVNLESNTAENAKRIHHRIDEIEKRVDDMNAFHHEEGCPVHKQFIAQRTEQVAQFKQAAVNLDERIKAIESKGAKRWEAVMIKVIEWGVLFALASVALRFGVKV